MKESKSTLIHERLTSENLEDPASVDRFAPHVGPDSAAKRRKLAAAAKTRAQQRGQGVGLGGRKGV